MKKIIILALAAFSAFSCKGFLNKQNPYKIESEYYFVDESSLEIYSNAFIRSFDINLDDFLAADRYADAYAWSGLYGYYTDNYTAYDASNWTTSNWSQLRSINYYLDNMRKASASGEILNHYEGVGRFFRALFYYLKVQTFGAVPIYKSMISSTDTEALTKDRDNREDVFRFILEDINYACENCLTSDKYRNRASYIHKYVALAYKARFCLYEGTYRKYHSVDPSTGQPWKSDESEMYLKECIDACEKLMESGIYSLADNPNARKTQYRAMFTDPDGCKTYTTNEWIWAKDNDETLNVKDISYSINDYFVNAQHAQYSFNRDFINTYLKLDGTPFEDFEGCSFVDECKDRDYRLAQTIRTPGFTRDGGSKKAAPDVTYSQTGYHPIKYLLDDTAHDPQGMTTYTDVPMMRYAEVLLSYAEAKAELGQMTEAVWNKTVKPIRERAGVKNIYPKEADPYMVAYFQNKVTDPYILEIRRERGIEYAMEYLRYHDIMRWHQGELLARPWRGLWITEVDKELDLDNDGNTDTIVTANSSLKSNCKILYIDGASTTGNKLSKGTSGYIQTSTALTRKWADYKYVKPIPATAITENPNLTQNPGW